MFRRLTVALCAVTICLAVACWTDSGSEQTAVQNPQESAEQPRVTMRDLAKSYEANRPRAELAIGTTIRVSDTVMSVNDLLGGTFRVVVGTGWKSETEPPIEGNLDFSALYDQWKLRISKGDRIEADCVLDSMFSFFGFEADFTNCIPVVPAPE